MGQQTSRKKRWYNFMLRFHIYGGLYVFPFFLVMGISSLEFNHHIADEEPLFTKEYSRIIHYETGLSEDSLGVVLKDSLDIYGYDPWWLRRTDGQGRYHFQIERPGRRYRMIVDHTSQEVRVKEEFLGFLSAMVGLHGTVAYNPGAQIYVAWRIYGESAILVNLLICLISLYLWVKKSLHTPLEWTLAIGLIIGVALYVMYLWRVG